MTQGLNGKTRFIYWLLGILFVLIMGFATYWTGKIQGIEIHDENQQNTYEQHTLSMENRMTKMETRYENIQASLDRIEKKLDLEAGHGTKKQ